MAQWLLFLSAHCPWFGPLECDAWLIWPEELEEDEKEASSTPLIWENLHNLDLQSSRRLHQAGGLGYQGCMLLEASIRACFFVILRQSCAWITTPPLMLSGLNGHTRCVYPSYALKIQILIWDLIWEIWQAQDLHLMFL